MRVFIELFVGDNLILLTWKINKQKQLSGTSSLLSVISFRYKDMSINTSHHSLRNGSIEPRNGSLDRASIKSAEKFVQAMSINEILTCKLEVSVTRIFSFSIRCNMFQGFCIHKTEGKIFKHIFWHILNLRHKLIINYIHLA